MRNLVFKNFTFDDKRRKVISSCEVVDREGVRSAINRHFLCVIKEVEDGEIKRPSPCVYIVKERNTQEQKQRFFCKVKGMVYVVIEGRLYSILFIHSLKISLALIRQDLKNPSIFPV